MDTNSFLRDALDVVSDAFIVVDREWRVMYANHVAVALFARSYDHNRRTSFVGRSFWDCLTTECRTRLQSPMLHAAETRQTFTTIDFYASHETWLEFRAHPWPEGMLCCIRDVTARAEEELGLKAAVEDAAEASRRYDEILAETAHALRTPLHTIAGFSGLLAGDAQVPPARLKEYSGQIGTAAQEMLAITHRLLGSQGVDESIVTTVPAARPAPMPPAETAVAAAVRRRPPSSTVLYIEDNPSNFQLIERIMEQRPHVELLTAAEGLDGIRLTRQRRPNLILLDVHLPDLQGEDVIDLLHEEGLGDIPVVVVSADATRDRIQSLSALGAAAYLTKPINVIQFLSVVDQALAAPVPARSPAVIPCA